MPLADRRRLEKKLEEFVYSRLREFPHFGPSIKKIKGLSPGTWRYRIGKWRVFYEIDEEDATVIMLAVADRKSAYR